MWKTSLDFKKLWSGHIVNKGKQMDSHAIAILMLSHNDKTTHPVIWSYEDNCFSLNSGYGLF